MDETLRIKVKEIFKNKSLNPNSIRLILNKYPDIKQKLEKEFNIKPKIYNSIGKLIILIVKDIQLKHCIACGKQMTYDRTISSAMFCSNKCKLSSQFNPLHKPGIKRPHWQDFSIEKQNAIKEKMKKTCLDRYGVERYSLLNTYNKRKERFKDYVIPLFSQKEYQGSDKIYKWKCVKCGQEFEQNIHTTNIAKECNIIPRCPKCYPIKPAGSSRETQLINFIKTFYNGQILENDRTIIKPSEIDVALPELKIAIEYNGSYWHSTRVRPDKNYHLNKIQMCQKVGYRLISIDESEWILHRDIIENKIKSIICNNIESIYARKCIIKQIIAKEKDQFLNKYHIQGADKAKVKLGLFYQNKLVAVMTFCKPRFNKNYQWELSRYATSTRIIGGASKLLKYFEKNYNPKSIITYADRRYSIGNLYYKLNFKLDHISQPNYYWTKNGVILTRYQTQKHKLKKLLGKNFDQNLTEEQNMEYSNFLKIYDCGNLVFIKKF